jgi:transposase
VVSEHGKIVKEPQVASEPETLASWIGEQNGSIVAIGLEAGPLSQWLHRGLSEAGLDVVLMETRQVKGALKAMPIKHTLRRSASSRRHVRLRADNYARPKSLDWDGPVTKVLSLAVPKEKIVPTYRGLSARWRRKIKCCSA